MRPLQRAQELHGENVLWKTEIWVEMVMEMVKLWYQFNSERPGNAQDV